MCIKWDPKNEAGKKDRAQKLEATVYLEGFNRFLSRCPPTLVLTTTTGSVGPRPHHLLAHSVFSVHKLEVLERGERCFGVTEMSQHINADSTVI